VLFFPGSVRSFHASTRHKSGSEGGPNGIEFHRQSELSNRCFTCKPGLDDIGFFFCRRKSILWHHYSCFCFRGIVYNWRVFWKRNKRRRRISEKRMACRKIWKSAVGATSDEQDKIKWIDGPLIVRWQTGFQNVALEQIENDKKLGCYNQVGGGRFVCRPNISSWTLASRCVKGARVIETVPGGSIASNKSDKGKGTRNRETQQRWASERSKTREKYLTRVDESHKACNYYKKRLSEKRNKSHTSQHQGSCWNEIALT
jgi:hypothetical protein